MANNIRQTIRRQITIRHNAKLRRHHLTVTVEKVNEDGTSLQPQLIEDESTNSPARSKQGSKKTQRHNLFKLFDPRVSKKGKIINDDDQEKDIERQIKLNKLQTEKDERRQVQRTKPLLEQWLDDYWHYNIKHDPNIFQLESLIKEFVSMLLEIGDEQLC